MESNAKKAATYGEVVMHSVGNDLVKFIRCCLVPAEHDDRRAEVAGHGGDDINLAHRLAVEQHVLNSQRAIAVCHDAAANVRCAVPRKPPPRNGGPSALTAPTPPSAAWL